MSPSLRLLVLAAVAVSGPVVSAADHPNPFGQAGTSATTADASETIESAGVTTVDRKTMVILHDKQDKRNILVEAGKTAGGITVLKYDGEKDRVTIRHNGVEKTLPLRSSGPVKTAPMVTVPQPAAAPTLAQNPTPLPPAQPAATSTATTASTPPGTTATTTAQLSQARQEEEARMLVSDLLEIGMAQRKAYEEAQRKAAAGQAGQAQAGTPTAGQQTASTTAQPAP